MTAIFLLIFGILALLLTAWLVIIPAGVVAGFVKALRQGGRRWVRRS